MGTGIADDIERMMSVYNEMLGLLSLEYLSAVEFGRYMDITRDICSRLDTINAVYVTKSFNGSYVQKMESLNNQAMIQETQDAFIEKMRIMRENSEVQNEETEYFYRLSRIIGDLYCNLYNDLLEHHTPPSKCPTPSFLRSKSVRLFQNEELLLIEVPRINSYRNCDIGLMYKILRNACPSLSKPTSGWDKVVQPTAFQVSDDIERIRQTRNKAFGHISSTPVSKVEYTQYVQTAKDICNRMDTIHVSHLTKSVPGTYQQELNKILTKNLDSDVHRSYVDALVAQAKREEDIFKTVTDIGHDIQHSIYLTERSIVNTIAEEGLETKTELLKAIEQKMTGIMRTFF